MLVKRRDAKLVKGVDPFFKTAYHIMNKRCDAQVFYKQEIDTQVLDNYIREKRKDGVELTHMNIIIAALVRLVSMRPRLNRFVLKGRLFAHNDITVAFNVKKRLDDDAEETTVKVHFDGSETIFKINEVLNEAIKHNVKQPVSNSTDAVSRAFSYVPNSMLHAIISACKYLDKINLMPKKLIEASPFHCSFYLTNLKSLKAGYVYHHLYEFGTNSTFISMGKTQNVLEPDRKEFAKYSKIMTLGITVDERICDGFYLTKSFRELEKIFENLSVLERQGEKVLNNVKF